MGSEGWGKESTEVEREELPPPSLETNCITQRCKATSLAPDLWSGWQHFNHGDHILRNLSSLSSEKAINFSLIVPLRQVFTSRKFFEGIVCLLLTIIVNSLARGPIHHHNYGIMPRVIYESQWLRYIRLDFLCKWVGLYWTSPCLWTGKVFFTLNYIYSILLFLMCFVIFFFCKHFFSCTISFSFIKLIAKNH